MPIVGSAATPRRPQPRSAPKEFAATPASAGSVDGAFLASLEQDGIVPPSARQAIKDAKAVCNMLDDGYSADEVIDAVAETTGLDNEGANLFAVDAASAYCPEYVEES